MVNFYPKDPLGWISKGPHPRKKTLHSIVQNPFRMRFDDTCVVPGDAAFSLEKAASNST